MEIINVHTTGNQIVNVVRDDIAPGSAEFYAMGIEDNEIGKLSYNPDVDILAAVMADPAMQALKAEDKMLADIVEGMGMPKETKDAEPQTDRAGELAEKWQTASGQLWKLGDHRLLIGDCTVRENVERLMGGERAGACVTDSPYGINREGIENDDPEGLRALFDGCLAVMPIDNGVIINFQSPRLFPVWLDAVRSAGHKFERALWWREVGMAYPWHGFRMQGEIIIVSSLGLPIWDDTQSHPDTFDDPNPHRDGHTTQKPITVVDALISHVIGDLYEPFAGSGTTIIAAHNLNRRCFAMEISEKYGAVILQRFLDATGIQPELMG